ncbi:hypothetical protein G6F68_015586 [Rhizopus microsporus]|nr:hypothetical protein G6F68_015586 [Rhizopus microsporus]
MPTQVSTITAFDRLAQLNRMACQGSRKNPSGPAGPLDIDFSSHRQAPTFTTPMSVFKTIRFKVPSLSMNPPRPIQDDTTG